MAYITYDGSARDHDTIPEVLKKGEDGKPMKRKILKPARTIFKRIEVYNLRGLLFPIGKVLKVTERDTIKKAANLSCFDVQILEGESLTYDKKWMTEMLEKGKITVIKTEPKNVEDAQEAKTESPKDHGDGLEDLKRHELMRLAAARGMSTDLSMKKTDIIELLRAQEAPARAELLEEGESAAWMDSAQDVG